MNLLNVIKAIILLLLLDLPTLSEEEIHYLKNNSTNLTQDYKKFSFKELDTHINKKKMVLLGESNHGTKEIFQTKLELIKYLHEKHTYNVLLIESGLAELIPFVLDKNYPINRKIANVKSAWRTKSHQDLFAYAAKNNLKILGFDVFKTGKSFIKTALSVTGDSSIVSLENRFDEQLIQLKNRNILLIDIKESSEQLISDYQQFYNLLLEHNSTIHLLTRLAIHNRISYLQYLLKYKKTKNFHQKMTDRDSLMAENIRFISEKLFPREKIIIHSHNIHTAKYNEIEEMMGEFLCDWYEETLLTIGMFPGSGTYSDYTGKIKNIGYADSLNLDIKHLIAHLPHGANYLYIKENSPVNQFFFEPIRYGDTFIDTKGGNKLILHKHFDAVILLKNASIPNFIRGKQ